MSATHNTQHKELHHIFEDWLKYDVSWSCWIQRDLNEIWVQNRGQCFIAFSYGLA